MDDYNLSSICAYIDDFIKNIKKKKEKFKLENFINERFTKCSEQKKDELYKIFNNFILNTENVLDDNVNINYLAKNLLEIL